MRDIPVPTTSGESAVAPVTGDFLRLGDSMPDTVVEVLEASADSQSIIGNRVTLKAGDAFKFAGTFTRLGLTQSSGLNVLLIITAGYGELLASRISGNVNAVITNTPTVNANNGNKTTGLNQFWGFGTSSNGGVVGNRVSVGIINPNASGITSVIRRIHYSAKGCADIIMQHITSAHEASFTVSRFAENKNKNSPVSKSKIMQASTAAVIGAGQYLSALQVVDNSVKMQPRTINLEDAPIILSANTGINFYSTAEVADAQISLTFEFEEVV